MLKADQAQNTGAKKISSMEDYLRSIEEARKGRGVEVSEEKQERVGFTKGAKKEENKEEKVVVQVNTIPGAPPQEQKAKKKRVRKKKEAVGEDQKKEAVGEDQ